MIDEKKLIAKIREKIYPEKFGERCNSLDVIYAILQLIDEQPKVNEWIPCSERLPDNVKYNAYLTTLEGELVGEDEPFTGLCGFEHGRWDEDCVIAWRELPEPWKGE